MSNLYIQIHCDGQYKLLSEDLGICGSHSLICLLQQVKRDNEGKSYDVIVFAILLVILKLWSLLSYCCHTALQKIWIFQFLQIHEADILSQAE